MAAQDEASDAESGRRFALARWGLVFVLGIGATVLGLSIALDVVVDAGFIERRVNVALEESPAADYRMEIGEADWSLFGGSLQLTNTILRRESALESVSSSPRDPSRDRKLAIPVARFEGLHRWSLLWQRNLTIDEVQLRNPTVDVSPWNTGADTSRRSGSGSNGGFLDQIWVHRLVVEHGTVRRWGGKGALRDSTWGLTLRLDSLRRDSLRGGSLQEYLAGRFVVGSIDGYRSADTSRSHVLQVGAGKVSARSGIVTVDSIRYHPPLSDSVFMDQRRYRTNRIRTSAASVEVRGLDVECLAADTTVAAELLEIDSLDLSVYRDNHLPEDPNDPPHWTPQSLVRSLDHPLDIDTIRVRRSRIEYAKRPEHVPESGRILFDEVWATLYGLTNDSTRMTLRSPLVVDARTDVAGTGRLHTTFHLPLLSPDLSLSYRGRLGPMNATAFNETFVNLGGVRIERGAVDSLWFDVEVNDGTAKGMLEATYRDLEIETLNRTTGNRGLRNRLKTFVVNGMALRSDNLPTDERFHTGEIQYQRTPDDSFFKFLWLSLRNGIYSMVGIDRLPR